MTRLRVQHAGMQRTDTRHQQETAVESVFRTGGLFIGFTEVGARENPTVQPILAAVAADYGYRLALPKAYGEAIAVKVPDGGEWVRTGFSGPYVHGTTDPPGPFPDRGARYVTIRHPDAGTISFVEWHANPADDRPARRATNRTINTGVADLFARLARGRRIVLGAADINVDDAHDAGPTSSTAPLRRGGLVSCWDELHLWPGTHGRRTIDVIYRYRPDDRVRLVGARVARRTPSDHRPIVATYEVKDPAKR